jgi:divalent metal cation (Fe/Co/Zn/Cd) transporter
MRTLKAVLAGFTVATVLVLAGGWAFTRSIRPAIDGEYYTPTVTAAVIVLLYTIIAIIIGSYVAARIHDSSGTTAGFAVAEAFFGFGLIREFWDSGSSWSTVTAVVLVIPCAVVGRALARKAVESEIADPA